MRIRVYHKKALKSRGEGNVNPDEVRDFYDIVHTFTVEEGHDYEDLLRRAFAEVQPGATGWGGRPTKNKDLVSILNGNEEVFFEVTSSGFVYCGGIPGEVLPRLTVKKFKLDLK